MSYAYELIVPEKKDGCGVVVRKAKLVVQEWKELKPVTREQAIMRHIDALREAGITEESIHEVEFSCRPFCS